MVKIPKQKEKYFDPVSVELDAQDKSSQSYIIRQEKSMLVARDFKGRIYSKIKLTPKSNKQELISTFKSVGSFNEDITKKRISKVYEISQPPSVFKKRTQPQASYYYDIVLTFESGQYKGQSINARSQRFFSKSEISQKREEALENIYYLADQFINGDSYDADKGKETLKKFDYSLTEKISYYKDV